MASPPGRKITDSLCTSASAELHRTWQRPFNTNSICSRPASGVSRADPPEPISIKPILPRAAPLHSSSISQYAATSPPPMTSATLERAGLLLAAKYIVLPSAARGSLQRAVAQLDQPHAAIDHEILAGDVVGFCRGKERGRAHEVLRGGRAAQDGPLRSERIDGIGLISHAGSHQILVQSVP